MPLPDFVIIGAMKCGTSTLQHQLAAQSGVFMSMPKEPNFFSDEDVYARGMGWYEALFTPAAEHDLKGEASTHYTKRPAYPLAFERFVETLPNVKLIYMMRHPIDRLVSHYVHEWSMNAAPGVIDDAAQENTPYTDYGRYAYQLRPFWERYGPEKILPVFLERMNHTPEAEFARVAAFLGLGEDAAWRNDLGAQNVSRERIRRFPFYDILVESAAATALRRALAPASLRNFVKTRLQMHDRPALSPARQTTVAQLFDEDLAELGGLLGAPLSCENFKDLVRGRPLDWAARD